MQLRYKSWEDIFWETWQSDVKMHLDQQMGEKSQEKKVLRKVTKWDYDMFNIRECWEGNKFKSMALLQKETD